MITSFMVSAVFILSITPSEMAAGLYSIKVPYKMCTVFSIAFRYIPDIGRDFQDIKNSMQMRGVELDPKKAKRLTRLKHHVLILVPLIISSFERVGDISNAMDLRGYGRLLCFLDYYAEYYAARYKNVVSVLMKFEMKDYLPDILNGITDLIGIPTVYDASTVTEQTPYGKNVYRGYQWIREKALKDGFEVLEYDNQALAIRIPGKETAGRIDVVCHTDVVEPGIGWVSDPFTAVVTDGHIVGRGAQDMKATLMLSYYALKYIWDNHIPCGREIRVVIGCDEERTMGDIKHYISKAGEPEFAYTPDGKFPYSLGEKGALMICVDGSSAGSCIEELDGGVQCNVVSPAATALIKPPSVREVSAKLTEGVDLPQSPQATAPSGREPFGKRTEGITPTVYASLQEGGVSNADGRSSESSSLYDKYIELLSKGEFRGEVSEENGKIRIKVFGKAAHASRPEDGDNATVRLLGLISDVSRDPLAELLYNCFKDYYGKGACIDYDIEPMGKLTLNLGVLKIKENTLSAQVDSRYPYGITSDVLEAELQKALPSLKVAIKYDDKPTLADRKSPYLKVLLDTYREVSGEHEAEPIISGGVSYSKVIKNCVAFGPARETDLLLAHQANERLPLDRLMPLFEIYTKAMIRLANL